MTAWHERDPYIDFQVHKLVDAFVNGHVTEAETNERMDILYLMAGGLRED